MAVRIGIPTEDDKGLDSRVAERFGRAPKFTVVDVDEATGEVLNVEVHDNPGYTAGSGAGVKAAQKLGDLGVRVYAGPTPGPNAYAALSYLGIKVVSVTGVSAREALKIALEELKG
ncbi:MAG: NifB/NifX family molybdenum-iron cluster-binding protein [Desulfurococcales archaeon]|nr:NifB/NifX family molybdenum-iron cluster-binding protein [Desulfurococcales archaeon]MEB3806152.1 NifB/NifX family molybdenum-iron cluster-binding protein [Desulfurococcales archaeon]